jgi:hypothetical protein
MNSAAGGSEALLHALIDEYDPAIASAGRRALELLRRRLPAANLLVYDSYNALAVAFARGETLSGAALSLTFYPRWISLFFTEGAELPDPLHLLRGSGNRMRHIVLDGPETIERPEVRALIGAAAERAGLGGAGAAGEVMIKSRSAKRRPRRSG